MRKINEYDGVYSDIDNTLIYGWYTDLMDITWNIFHSEILADLLMNIQAVFKIYKVNEMLRYQLQKAEHVTFVTARKRSKATHKLLKDILPNTEVWIEELATNDAAEDKNEYFKYEVQSYKCLFEKEPNFIYFEDSKRTRWKIMKDNKNVLVLDPVPMREVLYD